MLPIVLLAELCCSLTVKQDGSMFRSYRQQGCQFECRLRNSAKRAGCVPWDYPLPPGGVSEEICRNSDRGHSQMTSEPGEGG